MTSCACRPILLYASSKTTSGCASNKAASDNENDNQNQNDNDNDNDNALLFFRCSRPLALRARLRSTMDESLPFAIVLACLVIAGLCVWRERHNLQCQCAASATKREEASSVRSVTASGFAAAAGIHPWISRQAYWRMKRGIEQEQVDADALRAREHGTQLEDAALAAYRSLLDPPSLETGCAYVPTQRLCHDGT